MLPPDKKPLIDSSFDVAFADRLARYETYNKHNYRPNTYLHKWWGRRCGSTFRLILKGLVDDPDRQPYYIPGGLEGKVILDPMMGGGTTLHEALRLGANVMGMDIDPIPILQARAALTERSLPDLEAGFSKFYDGLAEPLGGLFRTHCPVCDEPAALQYALHGLRRRCSCREVLVVDSLALRQEPDGTTLRWCPACGELFDDGGHRCAANGPHLLERGENNCDRCGDRYLDLIDRPYFDRYRLLAVAGHCPQHGAFHKSPDWRDHDIQNQANARRASLPLHSNEFCVEDGDKSVQLLRRNVRSYLDLFSSRQLLFLDEVSRQLPADDAILRLNLALLVSTALEFNSMLCGYKGMNKPRSGAVRHTFAHHGYSFPYTALENNPLYPRRASGTLQKLFHSRISRGRLWAASPQERLLDERQPRFVKIDGERDGGEEVDSVAALGQGAQRFCLWQGSAASLPIAAGSVDAVVTDPPYYDSIQYGDLAAFFRVWLQRFVPDAAVWSYDESTAAVSSDRDDGDDRYTALLTAIFTECRRVLRPNRGRLIFTFHHWQARAWAALTVALYGAGFRLVNRYVVHAEHPMSVHISKMKALTHDAILVLAPSGVADQPQWGPSPKPDPGDSYRFTEGCATFMGWLLNQPHLSATEIGRHWEDALRGNHNDR
jgi:putative DNA methylase